MEYRVGSIADLISGTHTPNKIKVKKLTLDLPTPIEHEQPQPKHKRGVSELKPKKKKLKVGTSSEESQLFVIKPEMFSGFEINNSVEQDTATDDQPKLKRSKKLKIDESKAQYKTAESLTLENQHKLKKGKRLKLDESEASEELPKLKKSKKRMLEESDKQIEFKQEHNDNEDDEIVKPHKIKRKKDKNAKKIKKSYSDNDNDQHESEQDKIERDQRDSRTIFVGNVPVTIKIRQLSRLFAKYGQVENVRIRCIAPAQPGIPKRVAFMKNLVHPKRSTIHSYVTFSKPEDALKALEANGVKFLDHHLRVQISNDTQKPDSSKAIFVGNLPFDVEDEELWSTFESCGPIVSVRIIRNSTTNMGIGVAYVNFESSDAVELALQMEDVTVKNNIVRIQRYAAKKKHGQRHQRNKYNNQKGPLHKKAYKRSKNYPGEMNPSNENETKVATKIVKNDVFQGSKSNIKKKKSKLNKGVLSKMKLSMKIAPR